MRGPLGHVAMLAIANGAWSCGGPGNTGQSAPDPSLVRAVPWLNGVLPAVVAGQAVVPDMPVYPAVAYGLPDPGSRPPNCNALAGVELFPFSIAESKGVFDTFEPSLGGILGVARAWAGFDDLTKYAFHVPGDETWYPGLTQKVGAPWGLPAEQLDGLPACDGKPNNWALHFRGGLFRNWGGGVSHVFTDPDDACPPNVDFCPPPLPLGSTVTSAGIPCPSGSEDKDRCGYDESHRTIDASTYDGVAFWARRGPESQDRLLVTITDNFTSDRLARQNQKYCRRVRQCYTQCLNGALCSPAEANPNGPKDNPGFIYRCFDPKAGPLPSNVATGSATPTSQLDLMYPRCGQSACTFPTSYPDADFEGKACRPYTFPAAEAYIAGEFCFNEGDPPPPNRDERCLDGWVRTVPITTDWQFYTVPFSEFRQGNFGKRAPYFNLKAIDTIALGFIVGWADLFVDNVSFYRRKN
ncbi:MAG TPA: hypothetical protein VGY54_19635 [Polyangiaceae bacterium]|nr:hypothetical protein [Polyangiaceae bacterium]